MDYIEPMIFFDSRYATKTDNVLEDASAAKPSIMDMDKDFSFDVDFFMSDKATIEGKASTDITPVENKKPRAKRATNITKPEKNQEMTDSTKIPYIDSFQEPININRSIVAQADELASEIKTEFDYLRGTKTVKGKYTYLSNLSASLASLLQTKRAAASDIAKSINDSHNLELKRAKDLKELDINKKNDDARMMDMYSAFIHTPMGMYDNSLNMPTITEAMLGTNGINPTVQGVPMMAQHDTTITPEQARIRMESNNNIEEVVMYEPSTGRRWFEVIDKYTGTPIPNYPKSDAFLLEDTTIDHRAKIAKNRNLDRVWPLYTVGDNMMSEY